MPSTRPSSRCWPRCRCWPSARSCPPTGTGTSTTSAPTARASCRRSYGPGTMHRVTFASRLVPLLECALLALGSTRWPPSSSGVWSGVVAALLWLLNPLVLGLGHLDGVDLPFALTTVLVSWALVRWLRRRDRRSLLWLGAACGAAMSAQTTGLLLARWRSAWSWWRPAVGSSGVAPLAPTGLVVAGGLGARLGGLHRPRPERRAALLGHPPAALCGGPEVPGHERHRRARPDSCSGWRGRGPIRGSGRPRCWSSSRRRSSCCSWPARWCWSPWSGREG